jgi:branched-chain amino acid transport system ATP-binding protein
MDTLHHLRCRDLGILLVEQNAEIALDLADRVCVIDQGRVMLDGTAAEAKAQNETLAAYLGVG